MSSGRSAQVVSSIPSGASTGGGSVVVRSSTSPNSRPVSSNPSPDANAWLAALSSRTQASKALWPRPAAQCEISAKSVEPMPWRRSSGGTQMCTQGFGRCDSR